MAPKFCCEYTRTGFAGSRHQRTKSRSCVASIAAGESLTRPLIFLPRPRVRWRLTSALTGLPITFVTAEEQGDARLGARHAGPRRAGFAAEVQRTLADPRGWGHGGGDQRHPGHRRDQLAFFDRAQQDQAADRGHHRAAHPLDVDGVVELHDPDRADRGHPPAEAALSPQTGSPGHAVAGDEGDLEIIPPAVLNLDDGKR